MCPYILLISLVTEESDIRLMQVKVESSVIRSIAALPSSHNNPCFQCNIAITNFLVSYTCEIRFHDVIGQSTVHMYSYAKILKHG